MFVPFRRIFTKNYELSQVQNAIEQTVAPILNSVIIDGVLVKAVALTTTPRLVSHTLGRVPVGYMIVGRSAAQSVYDTARDSKTITLVGSGTVTVDAWIF